VHGTIVRRPSRGLLVRVPRETTRAVAVDHRTCDGAMPAV